MSNYIISLLLLIFLVACAGSNTSPNLNVKKYDSPVFTGPLEQLYIDDNASAIGVVGVEASDVRLYLKEEGEKALRESLVFSQSGFPIDITLEDISVVVQSRGVPTVAKSKIRYKFIQQDKTILEVIINSKGSDVSFSSQIRTVKAAVNALNHNLETLVESLQQYSKTHTFITSTASNEGDQGVLDWILVSPFSALVTTMQVTGDVLEGTATVMRDNHGLIQSTVQSMNEVNRKMAEENRRNHEELMQQYRAEQVQKAAAQRGNYGKKKVLDYKKQTNVSNRSRGQKDKDPSPFKGTKGEHKVRQVESSSSSYKPKFTCGPAGQPGEKWPGRDREMLCPAYYKCLWDNSPWRSVVGLDGVRRELDKSLGWVEKAYVNWKACSSLSPSCTEAFQRRTWGSHYEECLAEQSAPSNYSRKGRSM